MTADVTSPRPRGHRLFNVALGAALWLAAACSPTHPPAVLGAVHPTQWTYRGGWLAPRSEVPLESRAAVRALNSLRELGVTHVAVGHDVLMPDISQPVLEWGGSDETLRASLRMVCEAGLQAMLMPRIESPDFFKPPFPFRADIAFATDAEWQRFHDGMDAMVLHYAKLAAEEQVAVFGLGLEMIASVRAQPQRWRALAGKVREVFPGAITYSANWYEEWRDVEFWDALDFIGIGAYFELGRGIPGPAAGSPLAVAELVQQWRPVQAELHELSKRVGKPVVYTEVGYTGYVDCAARPWEWAGKQAANVAIDHGRQADAFAALFNAHEGSDWMHGAFLWTFYTSTRDIQGWEYAIRARPAEAVVRAAYTGR